jgi:hypothetical protein
MITSAPNIQRECEGAAKFFVVEFSSNDSFVKSVLQMAVTLTKVRQTQALLDAQQGRHGQIFDTQTWKVSLRFYKKHITTLIWGRAM